VIFMARTDYAAVTDHAADAVPVLPSRIDRALIAVVRIGVGLLWMQNAGWKTPPDFGRGDPPSGLYLSASYAVSHEVFRPYAWLMQHVVLPNFTLFGWMVLFVEASLGAFLLIGLATRFWAVIGVAQTVVIMLSVLNAPPEWFWSYVLMLLVHLALFATAAGRYAGLDGLLRTNWQHSRSLRARAGADVMKARDAVDRAALLLGVVSIGSASFVFVEGNFQLVQIRAAGLVVALVLGLLAVVAGLLKERALVLATGVAFLLAAAVQLWLLARGSSGLLGGNASTFSLWLGLGVGLIALGMVPGHEETEETSQVIA
jgi:thiosulfate dehydrogenase [quinone] large subunit